MVSTLNQNFSELSPRKQPPSPCVRRTASSLLMAIISPSLPATRFWSGHSGSSFFFFFFFFQPQGASGSTTSVELFWYYWNKSVSGLTPNSSTKSTWSLTYSSPRAAPDTNFSSSWGDEATIFFLQLSQLVQYNDIWSHMPILWSS